MNIQSNNLNKVWEELNTSSHSNIPQELLDSFSVVQELLDSYPVVSEELDININLDSIKDKLLELNRCISSDEHIYCPDDYSFVQSRTDIITSLINQILAQLNIQG